MDIFEAATVSLGEELNVGARGEITGRVTKIEHVMEGDPYKASGIIYYIFTVKTKKGAVIHLPQEYFSRINNEGE
jgi:hypothetical protein